MKVKYLIAICFAAGGLLTSCLSKPEFEPQAKGELLIRLEGSLEHQATKVNAQGFEDGDALGVYVVNYEDQNRTPGILLDKGNQVDHVKYVFDQANWKWKPAKPVYYKDVNTNVDLYAFYPYAEPSSVNEYNFEVQKDQSTARTKTRLGGYEASDFLWGKTENVAPSENAIKVKLHHKMAGVQVILQEGTGFEEAGDYNLLEKTVLVTSTTRKAKIDLSDGTVSPIGGAQSTGIVMAPQNDGSYRAIVVPQAIEAGTQLFSITVDGVSYGFSKDVAVIYESGKLNKFTIRLDRKSPSGEYVLELIGSDIVEWVEDINTHEGEARQYYCVQCEEPGTLGRLIKADKKNPDKIKNLKVSGVINDDDFYFMRDSMAILEAINMKEAIIYNHCYEEGEAVIPNNAFYNKQSLFFFTFPEYLTRIGSYAFCKSSLTGALIIPDDVTVIGTNAFENTKITSLQLSSSLKTIESSAFYQTRITGSLALPESLVYIGARAFYECSFTGHLELPAALENIGEEAFNSAGNFTGDLRIPDGINKLEGGAFANSKFTGSLVLNNVTEFEDTQYEYGNHFVGCEFSGELIIPEGVRTIPPGTFGDCNFTSVKLPSTLKAIKSQAFIMCKKLQDISPLPEGLVVIESMAFYGCGQLQRIELPSTLQMIEEGVFGECYSLNCIVSKALEPPLLREAVFDGVPKDNFTLEVPANSVKKYQAEPQWGEFKRISAHYDFSISRSLFRTLNAERSNAYILRAPANYSWSIESKPDWVTVSPASGTGKTEVTITVSQMPDNESSYIDGLKGRSGEVVFLLEGKDYRTSMTVEQYDYQYKDGDVRKINSATKGDGVDIVLLGDCYDARDIANSDYLNDIEEAVRYFFAVEPYKTYKDYFNVYMVIGESKESGMGTINTIRDAKFGSKYTQDGIVPDMNAVYEYAAKANIKPEQSLIILIENTSEYGGIAYFYEDGCAVACCPKSTDSYPYDFRGVIQHEAGGHAFGKLADENIVINSFFGGTALAEYEAGKALGWYRNVNITNDIYQVDWSHLIFNPDYSDVVDVYEGAWKHTKGIYRSEATSCMNNNIPYFSAISRQAIVERIMEYAGEEFTLEKFYANDNDDFGLTKASSVNDAADAVYADTKHFAPVHMKSGDIYQK